MDSQKTGTLIAARRCELGLTQKQLAEQLHLSDRTISRWERGVGFPDISLLEPLADALSLTVLELLQGERTEAPHENAEDTVRDAARTFGTKFKVSLKRLRWALVALAVIAASFLFVFLRLKSLGYLDRIVISSEEISASDALDICPFSLITTEDYFAAQQLLQDESITSHLPTESDENYTTTENMFVADDSILKKYEAMLQIDGNPANIIEIAVISAMISITYELGPIRCYLTIHPFSDSIEKCCTRYKDQNDRTVLYCVINQDNQNFSIAKLDSKLSLMLSK